MNRSGWYAWKSRCSVAALAVFLAVAWNSLPGLAHTPLLYIEDNGDGTIYVEGGFSDGSNGAGMAVQLEDADGNTLWEGKLDDFGSIESVPIPGVIPYYVVFEGGPGHVVKKEGISAAEVVEIEDVTPSSVEGDVFPTSGATQPADAVTSAASAQPWTAETGAQPAAWSPAATLSPDWMSGTISTSEGNDYAPFLWAIVGLLSFIVLQLLLLGVGMAFVAGWKIGVGRTRQTD